MDPNIHELRERGIRDFLYDVADRPAPTFPVPCPGGVAFYGGPVFGNGAVMTPNAARALGAALILAADEHEAIIESFEEEQRRAQQATSTRSSSRSAGQPPTE